jgi:hypothetical protein
VRLLARIDRDKRRARHCANMVRHAPVIIEDFRRLTERQSDFQGIPALSRNRAAPASAGNTDGRLPQRKGELSIMGNDQPIRFNIEQLNMLAARLRDHAEDVADVVNFDPVVSDLRLAALACGKFASLRFTVSEIANAASTPPATRRDLLIALEEAQGDRPDWPEPSRSSHHSS